MQRAIQQGARALGNMGVRGITRASVVFVGVVGLALGFVGCYADGGPPDPFGLDPLGINSPRPDPGPPQTDWPTDEPAPQDPLAIDSPAGDERPSSPEAVDFDRVFEPPVEGDSAAFDPPPETPMPRGRSSAAEIYAAVLRDVHASPNVKELVVDPVPTSGIQGLRMQNLQDQLEALRPDTLQSFEQRRKGRARLPARMPLDTPITWLDAAEFASFSGDTSEGPWETYWTRFPEGSAYIRLSGIGVSRDGLQALIYVGSEAGIETQMHDLALLERTPDGWRVIDLASVDAR